jgi:SNF2 family DNA or RNA helicase
LICPTTVVNNWRREAQKFTPELPVAVHHGPDRPRGKSDFTRTAGGAALMVSSYGLLHRDSELFRSVNWSGMILDEAQNIKNPQTKQFKAARALHADYRIALTGTPVENHVGDLWALMEFLNPGFLGSQGAFRQNFYRPIQIWQDAERAQQLKGLTGPFMLRRVKTDRSIIRDLPEKIESREFCTLSCEQASLYQAVVDDLQSRLEQVEGIQRRGLVLATLAKLKQVCNHPAHFLGDGSALAGRSGKLARLEGILEEILDCGERTLIFTQFAEMGTLLRQHLRERFARDVFFLHGATPRKKRDAMIADFQNDPQAPAIFILSLKAGGTGLTLTRANHVVHFDRWWNPAVEDQATDRAFRIGQTRNVQVHKLLVAGTLEERIDEMIRRKSAIAAEVVGTGEAWLSELSNAELSNLLRLGAEAIGEER